MLYIENERTKQSHRTKDTEVYITGYGLYHNDEKDANKKVS